MPGAISRRTSRQPHHRRATLWRRGVVESEALPSFLGHTSSRRTLRQPIIALSTSVKSCAAVGCCCCCDASPAPCARRRRPPARRKSRGDGVGVGWWRRRRRGGGAARAGEGGGMWRGITAAPPRRSERERQSSARGVVAAKGQKKRENECSARPGSPSHRPAITPPPSPLSRALFAGVRFGCGVRGRCRRRIVAPHTRSRVGACAPGESGTRECVEALSCCSPSF